jgi:hypothetical protein
MEKTGKSQQTIAARTRRGLCMDFIMPPILAESAPRRSKQIQPESFLISSMSSLLPIVRDVLHRPEHENCAVKGRILRILKTSSPMLGNVNQPIERPVEERIQVLEVHSSCLAANEMGGALTQSDGLGKGQPLPSNFPARRRTVIHE